MRANDGLLWSDWKPLTVTAPYQPDLSGMLTPGDTTLVQGGSLAIDAYTMNYLGAGTAAASTTGFYLSSDSTVNTADLLLTTKSAPSLTDYNANGNGWFDHESVSVTLPGNVGPGTYYLGAYADYQA